MEDDHKPVTKAELKDALEALKDELIEAFRGLPAGSARVFPSTGQIASGATHSLTCSSLEDEAERQ